MLKKLFTTVIVATLIITGSAGYNVNAATSSINNYIVIPEEELSNYTFLEKFPDSNLETARMSKSVGKTDTVELTPRSISTRASIVMPTPEAPMKYEGHIEATYTNIFPFKSELSGASAYSKSYSNYCDAYGNPYGFAITQISCQLRCWNKSGVLIYSNIDTANSSSYAALGCSSSSYVKALGNHTFSHTGYVTSTLETEINL